MHVGHLDLEVLGDGFLDSLDADLTAGDVEDVTQRLLGKVERELPPGKARERKHLFQRSLELSDV